jgi:ATP-binding cassette subfamily F protein 3
MLVAHGSVTPFDGDMDDYQQWLATQRRTQNQTTYIPRENRSVSAAEKKEQKRLEAERRKALRPLRNSVDKLETELDKTTVKLQQLESQLADNSLYEEVNKEKLKKLLQQQGELQQKSEEIEADWLDKLEQLEQLESETTI